MPAHWQVRLIPLPLVGGALSLGAIRSGSVPGGSFGSLFSDRRGCAPTCLLLGLGLLSADGWGRILPAWPLPEEHTLMATPEAFASSVLPPQRATVTPFSKEILQELQSGPTQIPMGPLLCPGTQCA